MRPDRVLFTGSSLVSHPVLDRLFGGSLQPGEIDLQHAQLVVVDARQGVAALEAGGIAQQALQGGIPVLVLAPGKGQLAPLAALTGVAPESPVQAALITPSAAEPGQRQSFEIHRLHYPGTARLERAEKSKRRKAEGEAVSVRRKPAGECCSSDARDVAVGDFALRVERRVGEGFAALVSDMPAGLKFFIVSLRDDYPFTASGTDSEEGITFKNGPGMFSVGSTAWGFLSQTKEGENSQYLIVETTYTLNPGTPAQNDEEGRGFGNTDLKSSWQPPNVFAPVTNGHTPTTGVDTWPGSLAVEIPYLSPTAGQQVYDFTLEFQQSIPSFSVQNNSLGLAQGSWWFMNSPCDGSRIKETWKDAYNFAGHVEPMPASCIGVLTATEASAWRTTTIQTGTVKMDVRTEYTETMWFTTDCALGVCFDADALFQVWPRLDDYRLDFSSIVP